MVERSIRLPGDEGGQFGRQSLGDLGSAVVGAGGCVRDEPVVGLSAEVLPECRVHGDEGEPGLGGFQLAELVAGDDEQVGELAHLGCEEVEGRGELAGGAVGFIAGQEGVAEDEPRVGVVAVARDDLEGEAFASSRVARR
jgi:hypothetical protein